MGNGKGGKVVGARPPSVQRDYTLIQALVECVQSLARAMPLLMQIATQRTENTTANTNAPTVAPGPTVKVLVDAVETMTEAAAAAALQHFKQTN